MLGDLEALLVGDALSKTSSEALTTWLVANTTGDRRLRAGVPKDWRVRDKTGTGERGVTNDVAIFWPPRRKPILIAAYLSALASTPEAREAAFVEVAQLVASRVKRGRDAAARYERLRWRWRQASCPAGRRDRLPARRDIRERSR